MIISFNYNTNLSTLILRNKQHSRLLSSVYFRNTFQLCNPLTWNINVLTSLFILFKTFDLINSRSVCFILFIWSSVSYIVTLRAIFSHRIKYVELASRHTSTRCSAEVQWILGGHDKRTYDIYWIYHTVLERGCSNLVTCIRVDIKTRSLWAALSGTVNFLYFISFFSPWKWNKIVKIATYTSIVSFRPGISFFQILQNVKGFNTLCVP